MALDFLVGPTFDIFRGGSTAVAVPFVVCSSDAARFEGTVLACREEVEGVGFSRSLCGWACGFDAWMGMFRATGSAGASLLCEKRQLVRLQFWMSGHLAFLNNPRLENMAVDLANAVFRVLQQPSDQAQGRITVSRGGALREMNYLTSPPIHFCTWPPDVKLSKEPGPGLSKESWKG